MASTDIQQTTQTDLSNKVTDYSITPVALDKSEDQKENYWDNPNYDKYNGFYLDVGQYGSAVDAYSTWVVGKGYTADARTTAILDNITGWGEDSFQQVLWNMLVLKKVQGDAFSEIIRNDKGTLINLKPLGTLRIVTNKKGRVIRYEQRDKAGVKTFQPNEILHICNNRIGDQIHGTSVTRRVEWNIEARREAMRDWRRISHRATIRVMYVDEDDKTRLTNLKKDYAEAINNGELLLIPGKRGEYEFQELTLPPIDAFLRWIQYLENTFYQELGVPKVILGGSEEFTEASSKIGYLTYEQVYMREVTELQTDLWNQVAIKIEFNKPVSLQNEMLTTEDKNQAQTGFQPNDMVAGRGK